MKTVAIIQARMGSTRLPGKVMKILCGKTVLAHIVTRVKACQFIDEVVVATTESLADNVIVAEAEKGGVHWFRGSEDNVLERYYLAAQKYKADVVVRITSDDPLVDPNILSQMLVYFKEKIAAGIDIDYLSNNLNQRTYPLGLDAEIFTVLALEQAYRNANQFYQKEHVTPYVRQHPEVFSLHNYTWNKDFSTYRWTLDTQEDWELISEIYSALYRDGGIFTTDEVLALFNQRPELVKINAYVKQKEIQ